MKNQFLKSKFHKWLLNWKPIHLCWFFIRMGWPIPKYLIGKITAPTCSTQAVSAGTTNTSTTLTGNGTVTNAGLENPTRGICYMTGTSGDPTTANSTATNGTGDTQPYTVALSGLTAGTAYRVRAYATNSAGTGYGTTVQAYTPPTVALNTPTDTQTGVSTTPTLNFTGTDSDSQTIEYNVQVDTVDTFDSVLIANSFDLKYVDLYLKKNGTPSGDLTLTIRSTSFAGSSLGASNTVAESSLSTSLGYIRFTFATPITISGTTQYYMVLSRSGADATNWIGWETSINLYSGGTGALLSGGSWNGLGGDCKFKIFDTSTVEKITQDGADLTSYSIAGPTGGYTAQGQSFTALGGPSPLLNKFSVTADATFTAGHPFNSATAIDYIVQSADILTANTPYYWRVSAKDTAALPADFYGAWSDIHSFTTAGGGSVIFGTTVWGQVTGVIETNIRTYASHWTGTGVIDLSGDAEVIKLNAGEYMESETVGTGSVTVTLLQNTYASGDNVTIQYRTGATQVACEAASYSTYSAPFASDGYVGIKLVSTL